MTDNDKYEYIYSQAGDENFPVASRLLPKAVRADFMALYGFARLIDDTGDESTGDRLARLDHLEHELRSAATSTHPVMARLSETIARRSLPLQPFVDLIEANRMDQRVSRYATFDDLVGYCELSANPVGRLVLGILDAATPQRLAWSDDVCTGLQVVEHLQDVAEDLAQDRIYLPLEDMAATGCTEVDLAAPTAGPAVRRVVALEAERARALLTSAVPLARTLSLRPRVAVAAFGAGGLAALDAIAKAGGDVLAVQCKPARSRLLVRVGQVLAGRVTAALTAVPGTAA
jgi:squalene synthase HpnC